MNLRNIISKTCLLMVALLLTGCVKFWPDEVASIQTPKDGIASQEAITIAFNSEFSFKERTRDLTNEEYIIKCVTSEIEEALPDQRIIPFDEFQRIAFPDLAPEAAPNKPRFIKKLLERPDFMEKIAPLNLRHIVFLKGASEAEMYDAWGMVRAPLGAVWRGKHAHLKASFLDLKLKKTVGETEASTSGTDAMVLVVFPLFFIAPTETLTCSSLGQELVKLLEGETPSNFAKEE
jgi:hypothetical protein